MAPAFRRARAPLLLCAMVIAAPAAASAANDIPEIVVTPYYVPTSIGRVGSAVTVITREQIARSSATTIAGLLRTVPGVTVIESGGPGATTELRIRGAETGHTVVLIDGVRVNDPATARDEFDFSLVSLGNIERIEVLRGPQSAVYGSDAMGGVVNVITRKPLSGTNFSATGEIGSYGTTVERLSGGTAAGDFRFLMSGEHVATHGFSRVGDREKDEADGMEKWSGSFSGAFAPADGPKVEFGVRGYKEFADYDGAPPAIGASCYQQKLDFAANAPNSVDKQLVSGFGKVTWSSLGGVLEQSVTGFSTNDSRDNDETSAKFNGLCSLTSTSTRVTHYRSNDTGIEYQGVADLNALGKLLVGTRIEREVATYRDSFPGFNTFDSDRTLYAAFLQDQVTVFRRLNLSVTGRYDGEIGGDGFLTGRATAAYNVPETGTKFRASAGTAAKRPTAYMIANNLFAVISDPTVETDLRPEKSIGADIGIDQSLFDGRLTVSATAFTNRFSDLISFNLGNSGYENIANAATAGVELSGELEIISSRLYATASYTYLEARDLDHDTALPRRPKHSGAIALTYTGSSGFEATLTATLVGPRFNKAGEVEPLPGYARFDLEASWPINSATKVFGRIENLTNARYQDPGGYNTPGLSAYVGLTWNK